MGLLWLRSCPKLAVWGLAWLADCVGGRGGAVDACVTARGPPPFLVSVSDGALVGGFSLIAQAVLRAPTCVPDTSLVLSLGGGL